MSELVHEVGELVDPGVMEWCAAELAAQARIHEQAARQERDEVARARLLAAAARCRRGELALRRCDDEVACEGDSR
jgi:hypothetical protein